MGDSNFTKGMIDNKITIENNSFGNTNPITPQMPLKTLGQNKPIVKLKKSYNPDHKCPWCGRSVMPCSNDDLRGYKCTNPYCVCDEGSPVIFPDCNCLYCQAVNENKKEVIKKYYKK